MISYGDNSTKRNILRDELELKWIKLLQTPHPLGFNDIYHEGNISRLPDLAPADKAANNVVVV